MKQNAREGTNNESMIKSNKHAILLVTCMIAVSIVLVAMAWHTGAFEANDEQPLVVYDLPEKHAFPESTAPRLMYLVPQAAPSEKSDEEAMTESMALVLASTLMIGAMLGAMAYIYLRNRKDGFSPDTVKADAAVANMTVVLLFAFTAFSLASLVIADDAGAEEIIDLSEYETDFTIEVALDGSVSYSDGDLTETGVMDVVEIKCGEGNDTLISPMAHTTWTMNGFGSVEINGIEFSGIENLQGAENFVDTFVFEVGGGISGTLDAGAGSNTLDFSNTTDVLKCVIHDDDTVSMHSHSDLWTLLGFIPDDAIALLDDNTAVSRAEHIDLLIGGGGDTTFAIEDGAEFPGSVDGGEGTNTLDYTDYQGNVDVDFTLGTATGVQLGISNIQNVLGGVGLLDVEGSGGEGETVSHENSPEGVVSELSTMGGMDNIHGTQYNDFLSGTPDNNIFFGKEGDDELVGFKKDDTYMFEDNWGTDVITEETNGGTDTLNFALVTVDLIFTFHDDDTVSVTDGLNLLDHVENIEVIIDGQGNDTYVFEEGATFTHGVIGANNAFFGMLGLSLGGGTNTLDLSNYTDPLVVDLGSDYPFIEFLTFPARAEYETDTGDHEPIVANLFNVTRVIGGEGDDLIYGSPEADELYGGPGDDKIWGRDSIDLLVGGQGNDMLNGGLENAFMELLFTFNPTALLDAFGLPMILYLVEHPGDIEGFIREMFAGDMDYASYGDVEVDPSDPNPDVGVTVSLADGEATGPAGSDTLTNIRALIGTKYNDDLTGDIYNNILIGGPGNDILTGGEGRDVLEGAEGDDTLDGGAELDIASYSSAPAAVEISLNDPSPHDTLVAGVDTYISIEGLEGTGYDDVLTGDGESNVLKGGGGNDVLEGGLGNDDLQGGGGDDTATYINASETLGLGVVVNLWSPFPQLTLSDGIDTLSEIENLTGSEHDDILIGNGGDNTLEGGGGDDLLCGGPGSDTYTFADDWGEDIILDFLESMANRLGGYVITDAIEDLQEWAVNALINIAGIDLFGLSPGEIVLPEDIDTLDLARVTTDLDATIQTNHRISVDDGTNTLLDTPSMEGVVGGTGVNTFTFEGDGVMFVGTINGEGGILDYSAYTDGIEVNLTTTDGSSLGSAEGTFGVRGISEVRGGGGDDTITGDHLDNILIGGAGNDTIEGLAGNDLLHGGSGDNILDGGDGWDTVTYEDAITSVIVDLAADEGQTAQIGALSITVVETEDKLTDIEHAIGSDHPDILIGDDKNNMLIGGEGNDTITGGDGSDYLNGGEGDDTIDGGDGDDIIEGGSGLDTINGGDGSDATAYTTSTVGVTVDLSNPGSPLVLEGATPTDTLAGIEDIIGSDHVDSLTGDGEANMISGGEEGDFIFGTEGDDTLFGGGGDDTIQGGAGNDVLSGGFGNDIIEGYLTGLDPVDPDEYDAGSYLYAEGSVVIDLEDSGESVATVDNVDEDDETDSLWNITDLIGSSFDDILSGNDRQNLLSGGEGDDILEGEEEDDLLIGGEGSDTASYASAGFAVDVNLGMPYEQDTGDDTGWDTLDGIENLIGSNFDDTLYGNHEDNFLRGGPGEDLLEGRAGDDKLEGGADGDILEGGLGNDTASYIDSTNDLTIDLSYVETWTFEAAEDSLESIESLIGGEGDDLLIGDENDNSLDGGIGEDVLYGRDGADTLSGGPGDDELYGEAGDDTLQGGADADVLDGGDDTNTASYTLAPADDGVTVDLTDPSENAGDAEGDTFVDIDNLTGSDGDDIMIGDNEPNVLIGGEGVDILIGNGGDDRLDGGVEADTLEGGDGKDTAGYPDADGAVFVSLVIGLTYGSEAEGDLLTTIECLVGSKFNDVLIGNEFQNEIFGGYGDDILVGNEENDILDGGEGNDSADYSAAESEVTVDLRIEIAQNTGVSTGWDTLIDIEDLVGSDYDDDLTGNDEHNYIIAGKGNDIVRGLGGIDILYGKEGTDILEGGNDDDMLAGCGGADELHGGDGVDGITYILGLTPVIISLVTNEGNGGDAEGDTMTSIENVFGSVFNDILTGNDQDNYLYGGPGNDTLNGSMGTNILEGGSGDDVLNGGGESDTASYVDDPDGVIVTIGGSATDGHGSEDTLNSIEHLTGSAHDDELTGDDGNNILDGGEGDDILHGMGGDDTLIGGTENDELVGGPGDDTFAFGDEWGDDTVVEEETEGSDTFDFTALTDDVTFTIHLTTGVSAYDDVTLLSEVPNIENLIGGPGDDMFVIDEAGALLDGDIDGGPDGRDTIDFSVYTIDLEIDLASGDILGVATGDVTGIENIITGEGEDTLSGDGNENVLTGGEEMDEIWGAEEPDRLIGNGGEDKLYGEEGEDILEGGPGGDLLDGGSEVDTVSYENADFDVDFVGVTVNLTTLLGDVGEATGDEYVSIENIIGSLADDTLIGNGEENDILGNAGDDELIGNAGDDVLDGDTGIDTVSYADAGAMIINLATGEATGDGTDSLIDIENVIGSDHIDVITGNAYRNVLDGGSGYDIIDGGDGWDTLIGGPGNDEMEGGEGIDTVSYGTAGSFVSVNLAAGTATGDGSDTLSGIENIIGSPNDDDLTGDPEKNRINGGGGIDTIAGAAGNDTYVFEDEWGTDTITDSSGSDTLDFSAVTVVLTFTIQVIGTIVVTDGTNIVTATGIDHLIGGSNDNTYEFEDGASISGSIDGGRGGSNTLDYSAFGAGNKVTVDLEARSATGTNEVVRIHNVITGAADDELYGDSRNNVLTGGSGADVLDGRDGTDTASYSTAIVGVTVDLDTPGDNTNDAAGDSYASIERIEGSRYVDYLYGDEEPNILAGGEGEDRIFGRNGDDMLEGGIGEDDLDGGIGSDWISYKNHGSGVTIDLSAFTASDGVETDDLTSIENAEGSPYPDWFYGDSEDNRFRGWDGIDTFDSSGGNDRFEGGSGDDIYQFVIDETFSVFETWGILEEDDVLIKDDIYSDSPFSIQSDKTITVEDVTISAPEIILSTFYSIDIQDGATLTSTGDIHLISSAMLRASLLELDPLVKKRMVSSEISVAPSSVGMWYP